MTRLDQFRRSPYRPTLAYVAIFGLLQIPLWVVVSAAIKSHLRTRFDEEILRTAQTLTVALDATARTKPGAPPVTRFREVLDTFQANQMYCLIKLEADETEIVTKNMEGIRFPFQPSTSVRFGESQFETLDSQSIQVLRGAGSLRVLSLYQDRQKDARYFLQVAARMEPLEQVEATVERLLLVFVLISVLVAGLSAWIVVRKSLSPIPGFAKEIADLSISKLNTRIHVQSYQGEIAELGRRLNELLDRLESRLTAAKRFTSHSAHELKTPLAILLGQVQQHSKGADNHGELNGLLASMEEELWRLLRTVESFLILARAEESKRLEITADVPMEDAILTAVQDCMPAAKARDLEIVPRFHSENGAREPIVSGGSDLLVSMMENLINNSIRHSPRGQCIHVDTMTNSREIEIKVRDRGPGIPEEHHGQIFEFLYQVSSYTKQIGKAGIGLAIVKAVVDLHGGSISLRNCETAGCEFTIRLPLADR